MVNIKNIFNEIKRVGASFIPYSIFFANENSQIGKIFSERGLFKNEKSKVVTYSILNPLISLTETLILGGYLWTSIGTGTIDYRKWSEIQQEKYETQVIQRKHFEKNVLEKSFNYFDSNLDGIIFKDEYKQGIENIPKEKSGYTNGNFYDKLNYVISLNEKRIDIPNQVWGEK